MKTRERQKGYSLIEILVVVTIFTLLGVLVTQITALSLRGTRKSQSIGKVRENVDYSLNIMERHLRGAEEITTCSGTAVEYIDENGAVGSFSCVTSGGDGYIASGSASPKRLTSSDIEVLCSGYNIFVCSVPAPGVPPSVNITIRAEVSDFGTTAEGSQIEEKTKVLLRSY